MKNKWTLLAFLCGLFLVYNVDRAVLGVLAIPIQKDMGISDVQFGLLSSGIFWTYALVVPFAGLLGDRFDRRMVVGLAAVGWSLMMLLAGFAGGFATLFLLVSVAVVIPQTLYSPTANALISDTHADTRTRALACHQAAYFTGWFISGMAVAGVLSMCGSWRWTFFILGGLGLVLGVAFLCVFGFGRRRTAAASTCKPPVTDSIRAFFLCPAALLFSVSYVVEVFVGYGYGAWGPK